MSFSSQIKAELAAAAVRERHCAAAEIAGAVVFGAQMTDCALYATEDFLYAKHLASLCSRACKMNIEGAFDEKRPAYAVMFDKAALSLIGVKYENGAFRAEEKVYKRDCCAACFVRGAFFAAGSVSAPEKMYRLDITAPCEENARLLCTLAARFGVQLKIARRKGAYAAYVKKSEAVSDTLAMMGARRAVMDLIMTKMVKERRNFTNRIVNCDTANTNKTVNASLRARMAIEKIGIDNLPESLREIARLRVENPEAGIEDLGRMLIIPLSKSGAGHRIAKIIALAKEEG